MLSFTLDPRRWWLACAFSRNPLVRGTDRVEALVIVLVSVVCLLAAPVAGAVGTAVYDARRQQYAAEVRTDHTADSISNNRAKAVGVSDIWASNTKRVDPPTSTARAGAEGVCAGAAILLSVVAAAVTLVASTHLRLSRIRNANWERELRCVANEDGGRDNRSYG